LFSITKNFKNNFTKGLKTGFGITKKLKKFGDIIKDDEDEQIGVKDDCV
jgi:hypothetical protein